MAIVTLRPNSIVYQSPSWADNSTLTAAGAVSDNDETTYVFNNDGKAQKDIEFGVTTFTIPVGAKVKQVRMRARIRLSATTQSSSGVLELWIVDPAVNTGYKINTNVSNTAFQEYTSPWFTSAPGGGPWSQTHINDVISELRTGSDNYFDVSEVYIDVEYNEPPEITVTGPVEGSTITTGQPVYTWTHTDPENDPQEAYRLKVFTAAQYGVSGFDPESSTAAFDSGKVFSSISSAQSSLNLANVTTYRAYVRMWQPNVSGQEQFSGWDYNQFTTDYPAPITPTIVGPTQDNLNARLNISSQAHENLLSVNVASVETDLTGFAVDTNCAIARSTAQAVEGAASLEMTASAAGVMIARTAAVEGGYPRVVPGYTYTSRAAFRAAVTGRPSRVEMRWVDSGNATISTVVGNYVTSTTTGWTVAFVEGVAPANAARALILWSVGDGASNPAGGEVHYVDAMLVRPGGGRWGTGGARAAVDNTTPFLIDLDHLGVSRCAWLPGAVGNYFSIPDTNIIDADTAHIHQSIGKWIASLNCTVARSTTQASFGTGSLAATATSEPSVKVRGATGGDGVPVTAGATYSFGIDVYVPRTLNMRLDVHWYDSTKTLISSSNGDLKAVSANAWQTVGQTFVSPAGAAFASVEVLYSGVVTNDVVYLDRTVFRTGSDATFLPSHRVTGDLDLRARVALKDWTPAAAQTLVAKWGASASYRLDLLTDGRLQITRRGITDTASTAVVPVGDRELIFVRGTVVASTGLHRFYTSVDGVNWTQLGGDVTALAGGSPVSADTVSFGQRVEVVTLAPMLGVMFSAEIRDGINGPVVASATFEGFPVGGTAESTPQGHTLTLNRSGDATTEIIDRNTLALTGVEYLSIPSRDALNFGAGAALTLAGRMFSRGVTSGRIISKRVTTGYVLLLDPDNFAQFALNDGTWATITHSGDRRGVWVTLVGVSFGNSFVLDVNGVAVGPVALSKGDLTNTNALHIGSESGGTIPFTGLVQWAAVLRRALTTSERDDLAAWDGTVANEPTWLRSAATFYWNADDPLARQEYRDNNIVVNLVASRIVPLTWNFGGRSGSIVFTVEYSDDGGVTWQEHPRMGGVVDAIGQGRFDFDYEVTPGVFRQYRVSHTVQHFGETLVSPTVLTEDETYLITKWWLKAVEHPDLNRVIRRDFSWLRRGRNTRTAVFHPPGRRHAIVTSAGLTSNEFTVRLTTLTEGEREAIEALLEANSRLLVQAPQGRQWYVRPIGELEIAEVVAGQTSLNGEVLHRFEFNVVEVGP